MPFTIIENKAIKYTNFFETSGNKQLVHNKIPLELTVGTFSKTVKISEPFGSYFKDLTFVLKDPKNIFKVESSFKILVGDITGLFKIGCSKNTKTQIYDIELTKSEVAPVKYRLIYVSIFFIFFFSLFDIISVNVVLKKIPIKLNYDNYNIVMLGKSLPLVFDIEFIERPFTDLEIAAAITYDSQTLDFSFESTGSLTAKFSLTKIITKSELTVLSKKSISPINPTDKATVTFTLQGTNKDSYVLSYIYFQSIYYFNINKIINNIFS